MINSVLVGAARSIGMHVAERLSYSPIAGQFLTFLKQLFAPADRIDRFGSAPSRPLRVTARHERCADAGDYGSSSRLPSLPSPANRSPRQAGRRTHPSGVAIGAQ